MRKPLGQMGGAIAGPLLRAATLLLLFSSVFCYAQDDCYYAQPTITNVTPTTWPAGKTTTVTITGMNLCFAYPGMILPDGGGSVTFSNVTYDDASSSLQFDAFPDASDPTETVTLDIGLVDGGSWWHFEHATIQIVNCPKPKITSLLPKTWFAGKSYTVKILGTGFNPTAVPGCPVTPVVVKPVKDVKVSTPTVSAKEIDFTVTPDASAATEVATITIGSSSISGQVTARAQILGNQIKCDPSLNCTQSVISTTDGSAPPVQTAVVGQQIALKTTTPTAEQLPQGVTFPDPSVVQPYTWTVGGTNIGGYSPSTASASVTPTTLTNPSLTTYFPYAGTNTVSYQYCVNIQGADPVLQCSLPANATFTVTGGGTMSNQPFSALTIDQLIQCVNGLPPANGGDTAPFLAYGLVSGYDCQLSLTGAFGMTFIPSGAPSAGTYSYAQLINSDARTANAISCSYSQGIDKGYPYSAFRPGSNPPQAIDAPYTPLPPDYTVNRSFNATMFLLWKSSSTNSISVPIGYQTWGFAGSAKQDTSGTWIATTDTTNGPPGPIGMFFPSDGSQTTDGYTALQDGYPIWSGPARETCR
jgi:hypothetical protein